jgi:hypothetical protein
VSYFRPQNARKIAPRSVCSLPNSTQKVSQKGGRVKVGNCAQRICASLGVHPNGWGTGEQLFPNMTVVARKRGCHPP